MINSDGFLLLNLNLVLWSSIRESRFHSSIYFLTRISSSLYVLLLIGSILCLNVTIYIDSSYNRHTHHYDFNEFKGEERLREALTDRVGPAEETGSFIGSTEQTVPAPVSPRDAHVQPSFSNGQFLRTSWVGWMSWFEIYIHYLEAARSSHALI